MTGILETPQKPVGAGLLAKAAAGSVSTLQVHRFREQALLLQKQKQHQKIAAFGSSYTG
jgi:hypothetical protein